MHSRIHPLSAGPAMLIPLLAGLCDVLLVTALFLRRETAKMAYLLNGLLVIYGIVTMGHYGLVKGAQVGGLTGLVGMAPVSAVLFADFLVGKALFDGYWAQERADVKPFNFLAPGWWLAHFVLIPAVYALGHILWK